MTARSPFTSARERRLWIWALLVVLAIYSTLGLARTFAGELRERELIDAAFWLGLFLVGAAVVTQGLKSRPRGVEIGIALGVAGAYLITLLRMTVPEERSHVIEYSVLALLVHEALLERGKLRRVPRPALLALAITSILGMLDESIQFLLPSRVFDLRDVAFNVLAVAMAISASAALHWARRWRERRAA